jgi:very-short-patch-repair endonuclease
MEWKTANPDRYELLKTFAKENRQFMTEAERALWMRLRGNALGHKFLRQHIIGDYIVDFLCRDAQVVIEVDGGYHKERQFLYKYPHSYFLMPNKSLPTQGGMEGLNKSLPTQGGMEGLIRDQVEEDRIRQDWLESAGYKVIRFTNEQILHNIDYALTVIKTTIDERYKRGQ